MKKTSQKWAGNGLKKQIAMAMLFALSLSLAFATCYVSDAPNYQSCGTANVTACSYVFEGKTYPGYCTDSPVADAITTASTGMYEDTGLSCTCQCKFWIVDQYQTTDAADGKSFNALDSGSTSQCPGN